MTNNLSLVDSAIRPSKKKSFFNSSVDINGSVSNFPKVPFRSSENTNININLAKSTVRRRPLIPYSNLSVQTNRRSSFQSCRRLKRVRNQNNAKLSPISRFPFGCSVHFVDNSRNNIERSSNAVTVSSPNGNELGLERRGRNQIQSDQGRHVSPNINRDPPETMSSIRNNTFSDNSRHSLNLGHSLPKGKLIYIYIYIRVIKFIYVAFF